MKDRNDYLQEQEVMNYFVQLVLALEYIHNRKVVHRDIKTSNILMSESGFIKIGDFGISKMLDTTSEVCKTFIGTPYYLAPELVQEQKYTQKADVWSIGVVLYELTSRGEHPFQSNSLMGLLQKITTQTVSRVSYRYSQQVDNVVQSLLNKNPNKRPSAREVLVNPIMIIQLRQFMVHKNTNQQKVQDSHQSNVDKGRISLEQKIYQNKLQKQNQIKAQNINIRITQLKQQAKDDFRNFKQQKKRQIDKYNQILNEENRTNIIQQEQKDSQKVEDDLMGQTIQSVEYSEIKNQLSYKKNDLSTKIQNMNNNQNDIMISQPLNQSYQYLNIQQQDQDQTEMVQDKEQQQNMSNTVDVQSNQQKDHQKSELSSQNHNQQEQIQKSIKQSKGQSQHESQQQSQNQSQNQSQHELQQQSQNQSQHESQQQSQNQTKHESQQQSQPHSQPHSQHHSQYSKLNDRSEQVIDIQVMKPQELSEQQILELDYENKHNDSCTLERLQDSILQYQQELEMSLPKSQSKLTVTQKSNISFNLSLTQDSIMQIHNQMSRTIPKDTKGSGNSDFSSSMNDRDSGEFNEIYGSQLMDSLKKSQGFNRHLIMKKELSDIQEDTLELQFTPGGKENKTITFGQNPLEQSNLT